MRVVTRTAERAKTLPKGVVGVVGDLANPDTYEAIFRDYDHLFLLTANGPSDLMEGLAAVAEARRTGARRVVHLSIQDVEKGLDAPHFASKIAIEAALKQSGLPWTILRPNNFYQNDYWWKDAILQYGVYPQPIGSIGLSRVDTRDIGDAGVRALTESRPHRQDLRARGPGRPDRRGLRRAFLGGAGTEDRLRRRRPRRVGEGDEALPSGVGDLRLRPHVRHVPEEGPQGDAGAAR